MLQKDHQLNFDAPCMKK